MNLGFLNRGSLRLRLSLAAAALIALALGLAGSSLVLIVDRVLDARTAEELDVTAKFLAGQVSRKMDGTLTLDKEPADPRYAIPYGGFYWQVGADGTDLRSRSLWDKSLSLSAPDADARAVEDLDGPDGGRLIAVIRRFGIGGPGTERRIVVAAAIDRRNLEASRATFLKLLVPSLIVLGLVLAIAMSLFIRQALGPFRLLREDLRAIHEGRRAELPSHFPDEVQPLVLDLNRLISVQEQALSRARSQAGDMAHGLKTPLAVLAALARRQAATEPGLAAEIEEQTLAMNRQVERSLVRARLAAGRDLRRRACPVAPVVTKLVATLRRLPDADSLVWDIAVPADLNFPGDEGDLTELLGNLLDNACKWAHRRISISTLSNPERVILMIADDGPGMSEAAITRTGRGMRWDEGKPGTGFGIAIAGEIAEGSGARLSLSRSQLGGLAAALSWPLLAKG